LDLAVIRHVSHTLKSSSASLGATALSQRCATIEFLARDGRIDGLPEQLDAMLEDIQQVRAALAALL
jgi:HPt (histidine-containing phosphotransfer) domain-containing protein